jgi:alanine racemase
MKISSAEIYNILDIAVHDLPIKIVEDIHIDSRKIIHPEQTLFVALVGNHLDGHKYIENAYKQGVRNFLISQTISYDQFPNAHFYKTENATLALQKIAKYYRDQLDLEMIAITGSNGKTIVKEWLSQVLTEEVQLFQSPLSYNSQIGVPLSLSLIPEKADIALIEAGISRTNEMANLAKIIRPIAGIFTHLGDAHSAGFTNKSEKLEEKLKLFQSCETIYFSSNQDKVYQLIHKLYASKNLISWGKSASDFLQINQIDRKGNKTIIHCTADQIELEFIVNFIDPSSIENLLHVITYLLHKKYTASEINKKIGRLQTIPMRQELIRGIRNCILINDSYSADISSLQQALEFQNLHAGEKSKTIILTDFLQQADQKKSLYKTIAKLIRKYGIDRIITIGNDIVELEQWVSDIRYDHYENINEIVAASFANEAILLKGARKYKLERIAQKLQFYNHKACLEINLTALDHNLNFYRSFVKEETKLMAILKAGAYGSGSVAIAKFLQGKKVDYIVVALIDEGIELRENNITADIVILNPDLENIDKIFQHKLQVEIYSLEQLEILAQRAELRDENLKIHINLDSGMHRLGIPEEDIDQLISILGSYQHLHVESIFSHFAGSEDPELDGFSKQQYEYFLEKTKQINSFLNYKPLLHMLNSSGIVRFPHQQLDMVRLGLGIYGIDSTDSQNSRLRKVHTLKAYVMQVKNLKKGESVGYNRQYICQNDKKIATISIGYADGLPRNISGKQYNVIINGVFCPIIGNVSMDLSSVDVSGIKHISSGDEVIIFGNSPLIEQLAEKADTIPYEILTKISARVKRVAFTE